MAERGRLLKKRQYFGSSQWIGQLEKDLFIGLGQGEV